MITLGSATLGAAVTRLAIGNDVPIIGKSQVSLWAIASGLASGTTAKAYVQTKVDGLYYDIACFAFTTGTVAKALAVEAGPLSAAVTHTNGGLTDDTAIQGLLGQNLFVILTTVGTYTAGSIKILGEPH